MLLLLVRPALRYWLRRPGTVRSAPPVAAAFAMASAWVTGSLGLHVIFGAFLAGLLMPRLSNGEPDREVLATMDKAGRVLLPVFFVVAGLSTDIGGLHASDLALFGVVCVLATAGKLGAGLLAARAGGLSWADSSVVGVLLNTRGLTELVALDVGLRAGLITGRLYTVFVLMALVTTAATGPLLTLVSRRTAKVPAEPPGLDVGTAGLLETL